MIWPPKVQLVVTAVSLIFAYPQQVLAQDLVYLKDEILLEDQSNNQSDVKWYSETNTNGITIQSSFPKGGPYLTPTEIHHNYSYLVFFTRVVNETEYPIEFKMHFEADSVPIPDAPETFMKLFLPPEPMSLEKQHLFSYGLPEWTALNESTEQLKRVEPGEDFLFYTVAIFYQTAVEAWSQYRGGNRAELIMKGTELFYQMPPQVDLLPCGKITFLD